MEDTPLDISIEIKPPQKKAHTRRINHAVQALVTAAVALNIANPLPPTAFAESRAKHENVDPDSESNERERLRTQLEHQFSVELDGPWTIKQLQMMQTTMSKLPPKFLLSHPGEITHFSIDHEQTENGSCQCSSGINLSPFSTSSERAIKISLEWFEVQSYLDLVMAHEGAHAASLIYNDVDIKRYARTNVWYQDEIEIILDAKFPEFKKQIWETLESNFPKAFMWLTQYYRDELTPYNKEHGPKSYFERIFDPNFLTLAKVDRWAYALHTSAGDAPTEFIAVMAEWYIGGKERFMERSHGVIDQETAEKLYEFMRVKFFDKLEYDVNGNLLSQIPIPTHLSETRNVFGKQ